MCLSARRYGYLVLAVAAVRLVAAAAVCSGMVRDGGGSTAAAAFKQGRLAVQPIPPNHTCENLPVV